MASKEYKDYKKVLTDKYGGRVDIEIRLKKPALASKVDHGGNSRKDAINMVCWTCTSPTSDIKTCTSYSCPLWRFRPIADTRTIPEGKVPTPEEYAKLLSLKTSDAQRAARENNATRLRKNISE